MIPTNEMEVIVLFAQEAASAGFEIIKVQNAFPDALISRGGVEYLAEFEFCASNFEAHRHDTSGCDLIICWENDMDISVLPILALIEDDWKDQEIVKVPERKKRAVYWKILATRRFETREFELEPPAYVPAFVATFDSPETIKMVLDVWDNEGLGVTRIGEILYGCRGGKQNEIVRKILTANGRIT